MDVPPIYRRVDHAVIDYIFTPVAHWAKDQFDASAIVLTVGAFVLAALSYAANVDLTMTARLIAASASLLVAAIKGAQPRLSTGRGFANPIRDSGFMIVGRILTLVVFIPATMIHLTALAFMALHGDPHFLFEDNFRPTMLGESVESFACVCNISAFYFDAVTDRPRRQKRRQVQAVAAIAQGA